MTWAALQAGLKGVLVSWWHDPELREALEEFDPTEEDEALIRHVLLDDQPPQGLHRGGVKETGDGTG